MTKYEWETELRKCMHRLPRTEQDRVLEYYNELFADQAENGRSEKQIINEFGNPSDVAFKIMTDYGMDVNVNDNERKVAVPEFYGAAQEKITPPDFWQDRGARSSEGGSRTTNAQTASGARAYGRSGANAYEGSRYSQRSSRGRESENRGCFASVMFLIEIILLGGLFIGVVAVIWSMAASILAIGYSLAAAAVYAVMCACVSGIGIGMVLVNAAVAVFCAGIAFMIVPNTWRIIKGSAKLTKKSWNLFFGWYTKKKESN